MVIRHGFSVSILGKIIDRNSIKKAFPTRANGNWQTTIKATRALLNGAIITEVTRLAKPSARRIVLSVEGAAEAATVKLRALLGD